MDMFDSFGPEKIVEVYDARTGMHGFIVIDNTALGPGKGGIRMTPTVNKHEVFELARTMTWKNALAELPFGGAKAGIISDPHQLSPEKKQELITSFAKAVKELSPSKYIAAPDISTAEKEMRTYANTNGDPKSCTGKPKDMGGIPHELGSTGFGVFHATKVALEFIGMDIAQTTFAIEGFGNVGSFAAKFISEAGGKLIAVSDSKGVVVKEQGLDFDKLSQTKKEKKTVTAYGEDAKVLPSHSILKTNADVLITAAIPHLVQHTDIPSLKFKLIVEGSNIPMTHTIEEELVKKGITIIPDFVANAGGVISSYVEYKNGTVDEMFKLVEEKITKNTKIVLEHAKIKKLPCTRCAALEIAIERVREKCETCGRS